MGNAGPGAARCCMHAQPAPETGVVADRKCGGGRQRAAASELGPRLARRQRSRSAGAGAESLTAARCLDGWPHALPGRRRAACRQVVAGASAAGDRRDPVATDRRAADGAAPGAPGAGCGRSGSGRRPAARRGHVPARRAGRRGVRRGVRAVSDRWVRAVAVLSCAAAGGAGGDRGLGVLFGARRFAVEDLVGYRGPKPQHHGASREELRQAAAWIRRRSRELRQECAAVGVPYVDVGEVGFEAAMVRARGHLLARG